MTLRRVAVVACVLGLLLAACSSDKETNTSASATPVVTTPAPTKCALENGSLESQRSQNHPTAAPLTDLRYEKEGCPRLVFEFRDHVPGYLVEYADPPFSECGSGKPIATDTWHAKAFLRVRLEPSSSVDMEAPNAPTTYNGSRDIYVGAPALKHLKVDCDFEAVFEWVVGLDARHEFTVFTLDDPARIVIDISET